MITADDDAHSNASSSSSSSDVDEKIARKSSTASSTSNRVLTLNLNTSPPAPLQDGEIFEAHGSDAVSSGQRGSIGSLQLNSWGECLQQLDAVISAQEEEDARTPLHNGATFPRGFRGATPSPAEDSNHVDEVEVDDHSDGEEQDAWNNGNVGQAFQNRPLPLANGTVPDSDSLGTWPRRKFSTDAIFNNGSASPLMKALHNNNNNMNGMGNGNYGSQIGSPLNASRSDIFMAWEEDNFGQLSTQLANLEQKIQSMSTSQSHVDAQNIALQRENTMLRERVAFMEEQLREEETRARNTLHAERQAHSEKLNRLQREHQSEVDDLRERYHQLELENAKTRLEIAKLKSDSEKTEFERLRLEEKLEESNERMASVQTEVEQYREFSRRKMEDIKRDRDAAVKAMEELHDEVLELRTRLKPSTSFPESLASSAPQSQEEVGARYREVQEVVRRLTRENRDLMEQLEEARAEIFTRSVEEGRRLMRLQDSSQLGQLSWQVELEECNPEELVVFLRRERETTTQLRAYIERMVGRIMEEHPTLLERPGF